MSARSSERQREQLHLVGQGAFESVTKFDRTGVPDDAGEFPDGVVGDGEAGEHHRGSLGRSHALKA